MPGWCSLPSDALSFAERAARLHAVSDALSRPNPSYARTKSDTTAARRDVAEAQPNRTPPADEGHSRSGGNPHLQRSTVWLHTDPASSAWPEASLLSFSPAVHRRRLRCP